MDLQAFPPAGTAILLALGLCLGFTALSVFIGPKRTNPSKGEPVDCGSIPIGSPHGQFSIKFYHVAILFLVFDIEAAFMYPWALLYTKMSTVPGGGVSFIMFIEMVLFVVILVAALAYLWGKKALGWESK